MDSILSGSEVAKSKTGLGGNLNALVLGPMANWVKGGDRFSSGVGDGLIIIVIAIATIPVEVFIVMDEGESTARGAAPVIVIIIGGVPRMEAVGKGLTGAVFVVGLSEIGGAFLFMGEGIEWGQLEIKGVSGEWVSKREFEADISQVPFGGTAVVKGGGEGGVDEVEGAFVHHHIGEVELHTYDPFREEGVRVMFDLVVPLQGDVKEYF